MVFKRREHRGLILQDEEALGRQRRLGVGLAEGRSKQGSSCVGAKDHASSISEEEKFLSVNRKCSTKGAESSFDGVT